MTSEQQPLPQKITQIQCYQTNSSLQSQFVQWFSESFKYKPEILNYIQDELEVLLAYADYKLTIAQDKAQPGDYLQNIAFKPLSTKIKVLWLIISVLIPYLAKKITNFASDKDSPTWKTIYGLLMKIQKIISAVQFVNYAIFIWKGEYRCLTQRILGIKMRFIDSENKRVLDFSLMNRMLVWQVYQFFLKNVLPHAYALFLGPLKNIFYLSSYLEVEEQDEANSCIYCATHKITMPYQAIPCLHKACYYCVQTKASDSCKLCSKPVQAWDSLIK